MWFEDKIVSGKELQGIKKKRSHKYIYEKFEPELQEKSETDGWELYKPLKTKIKMKKEKPLFEQFEDEVWILFASLGFHAMNKDNQLKIPYKEGQTKQIDVVAIDEETVLLVECKCATTPGKTISFKTDIEAMDGIRAGLYAEVRKQFPDRKIRHIFATKNYKVGDQDLDRMKQSGISYFDERVIQYFYQLAQHLGSCARFQLLGYLFEGQEIKAMHNCVPAIEGKMGGHKYYTFSVAPDKLLKMAYVLHRDKANDDMMPTYQRIIKKDRLKEIQKFIAGGGFFPNSLILNIDVNGGGLRFDPSSLQVKGSIPRIGVLHLPKQYRSAYIIDGQHRLYGYAESQYALSESVPVVAFVNLEKAKQVELFMEINENQKSVSKRLRDLLNADLLWESADWNKRRQALRLMIAQNLGESQESPLQSRVIIGEGAPPPHCCITTDTIENALKLTNFFSRYKKENNDNVIVENGTFDKGENRATLNKFLPFLQGCFFYFKNNCSMEWEKEDSAIVINNSIHPLIRIFNDILNHLLKQELVDPVNDDPLDVAKKMENYLRPLVDFFNNITIEQKVEIRKSRGSGGKVDVWRTFQKIIAEAKPKFSPTGLTEWIRDNGKQFNDEAFPMIQKLESAIKQDFSEKLSTKYGSNWLALGLPQKVYRQANNMMGKRNFDNRNNGIDEEVSVWDCVTIANCRDITIHGSNWTELFEKTYTRPSELRLSGGKKAKTEWIAKLAKLINVDKNDYSVTEEEYIFLKSLYEWLVMGQ